MVMACWYAARRAAAPRFCEVVTRWPSVGVRCEEMREQAMHAKVPPQGRACTRHRPKGPTPPAGRALSCPGGRHTLPSKRR